MFNIENYESFNNLLERYHEVKRKIDSVTNTINKELSKLSSNLDNNAYNNTLILNEFENDNSKIYEELYRLRYELYQIEEIIGYNKALDNGKIDELKNKTNREWINMIIRLLYDYNGKNYNVEVFNRRIDTENEDDFYNEVKIYSVVALVKDGFDINDYPSDIFSDPDKYPEYYALNDFVLYDLSNKRIYNLDKYLEEKNDKFDLYGMPELVIDRIYNILFKEVKNILLKRKLT